MVPEVGIAPTSPRLQRGANLSQLLGGARARPPLEMNKLVVPRGNAPRSSGYQPDALLLSYETMAEGVGNAPTSVSCRSCFQDRCSQLISACLPKWSGWQELHLRPPRSEQGRLLLTLHPEKWLPDLDSHQDKRLNRPPCYFHTIWQWCCRQDSDLHCSV